jgi:hypothetical protein
MRKATNSRVAVHQMGHRAFGHDQPAGLQTLMHLWDAPVFPETPEANERNAI